MEHELETWARSPSYLKQAIFHVVYEDNQMMYQFFR